MAQLCVAVAGRRLAMAAQTQVAVVSFHSSQALFFGPAFLTYLSWSSRLTKFELCHSGF
jgi:hypothetical protein